MADTKRTLSIRLSADGGADVTNTFKQVGESGQQAFTQIDQATASTATGLGQLDRQLTDLQRQINTTVGVGGSGGSAQDSANVFKYAAAQQAAQQIAAMQASQANINQLLGVGGGGAGSAAASAAVFEEAADAIKKEQLAMAALDAEARQLLERLDPLAAAQHRYAASVETATRLQAAGRISAEQYQAALAAEEAELNSVRNAVSGAGTGVSKFGFIAQQAGYQVGDFAVQVASGSGVMRPLIQQGTQLISAFGPWGAVIGAAGAVVGALAIGLDDTKDSAADAAKAIDTYKAALEAADEIAKRLKGDNQQTLDDLDAERRYRLGVADAALQQAQASVQAAKAQLQKDANDNLQATLTAGVDTSPAFDRSEQQLQQIETINKTIIDQQRQIAAELQYGGQNLDPFSGQGSSHAADYYQPDKDKSVTTSSPTSHNRQQETKDIDDQQSALAGLLDKMASENNLLTATDAQRQQLSRQREIDTAVTQAQADAEKDYQAGLRDTEILTQSELQHVKDLAAAHYDLTQAQKQSGDSAKDAAKTAISAFDEQKQATQELTGFIDQSFDRIGSAITQSAVDGGNAFKSLGNIADAIVSEIEQEFIKLAFINPLKNLIDGGHATTLDDFLGAAGNALGGWLGGGGISNPDLGNINTGTGMLGHAASGGYIQVGEHGPEKFYPGVSGTVAPTGTSLVNDRMWADADAAKAGQQSSGGVEVNVNNYGNDQATATRTKGLNQKELITIMIGEVSKDIAAGGKSAQAIQGRFALSKTPGVTRG